MKLKLILFVVIFSQCAFSQTNAEKFIKALINNSGNIKDFADESEITRSERLGITYTGVKNKFLIGYDIDEQVKSDIKEGRLQYDVKEKTLEDNYSQVEFSISSLNYGKLFYFRDGKFISPTIYLTRNWQTKESKYFIFKISEPKYFNDYCVKRLDDFVDKIADTLEFSESDKRLLHKEKIYYIFCKDEDEVQALTGYKSKGQAILAFDEVITAYQTHFHELSHLLINYKLKNLGLYTLPFFMEGFAVAMGGRGGMAPRVVTDVGYYLQKTAFLTYDSILTYDAFTSQDANMTYAVSGLYNMFLFNELGAEKYLELYKKVNGDLEYVKNKNAFEFTLPNLLKFDTYLEQYDRNLLLTIDEKDTAKPSFNIQGMRGDFCINGDKVKFFIDRNYSWGPESKEMSNKKYKSRKYSNIFPQEQYRVIKYCVTADSNLVDVINLYTDEIIFSFRSQFSTKSVTIPKYKCKCMLDGAYVFFLKKELFGDDFEKGFIFEGDFR